MKTLIASGIKKDKILEEEPLRTQHFRTDHQEYLFISITRAVRSLHWEFTSSKISPLTTGHLS